MGECQVITRSLRAKVSLLRTFIFMDLCMSLFVFVIIPTMIVLLYFRAKMLVKVLIISYIDLYTFELICLLVLHTSSSIVVKNFVLYTQEVGGFFIHKFNNKYL